jgi:hypothetical protein
MTQFEYKVVPAPKKGKRGKGIKGNDGKFANALEAVMNEWAVLGWEYQRTDTLPSEERLGLTRRTTVFQNMLIFRRTLQAEVIETPVALITDETAPEPELIEDATDSRQETPDTAAEAEPVSSPDEPGDYDGPDINSALGTRVEQVKSREGV